jgi:DNA polymerase III delta subunit
VYSFLLNKDINEKTIVPCYFLYGVEIFLAEQFVENVKTSLIPPEDEHFHIEKFRLEECSWMDVFDAARMVPFFMTSWRIIVITIPKGKIDSLTPAEEKIFRDYFISPQAQTVIIIIMPIEVRKYNPLYKLISSLTNEFICIKEIKPLKDKQALLWIDKKLTSLEKHATFEAKKRLLEMVGSDLGRLNSELEKIVTFVNDKKVIELDDVNQVSGWAKSFFEYEIENCLEDMAYDRSLIVLNELLNKEGLKPEYVLGRITGFFRNLLLAKLWLKEKTKDKKAIFKEIKPQIQEKFGTFYTQRFKAFFLLTDRLSLADISTYIKELREIDLKIKTSDVSLQILIEGFLYRYCAIKPD